MEQRKWMEANASDELVDVSGVDELIDISPKEELLSDDFVATAFQATKVGNVKGLDFFELRHLIRELLRSSGGRPALAGANSQVKIPKIEEDWEVLKKLALASGDLEHRPSTTQMAAAVLHLALKSFSEEDLARAIREELA